MPLGKRVSQIRSEGKYIENNDRRRQQLDKLGFVWRLRSETQSAVDSVDISFDQIYEALKVYRNEVQPSGPLTVPAEFTVPETGRWPESLRGLPLGRSVQKIRTEAYLKEHPEAEEKLNSIGFQLSAKIAANDVRFDNVYAALKRYVEIYGDLMVPQPFEVPSDTQDWPKATWGLRLGARVNAIRSQGTFVKSDPERRKMLDDLGFVWTPPEGEGRKRGRKSKSEIEEEDAKRAIEIESLQDDSSPVGRLDFDDDDLDSFVASFDFSGTDSSEEPEEADNIAGRTWGFEEGAEFQEVIAAAKEEAAQNAADEYKPPKSLEESLAAARQRALDVGIIEGG